MMHTLSIALLVIYGIAFVVVGIACALAPLWYRGPE